MNSHDDAKYRLDLALGYAKEAEDDLSTERWWACVSNAQVAIENAGKALIACFEPVEKVHELVPQLERLLKREQLPDALRRTLAGLVPIFARHGHGEHIKSTYGDDSTRTPPWQIYKTDDARRAVTDMQTVIRTAQQVMDDYFKSTNAETP